MLNLLRELPGVGNNTVLLFRMPYRLPIRIHIIARTLHFSVKMAEISIKSILYYINRLHYFSDQHNFVHWKTLFTSPFFYRKLWFAWEQPV